MPYILEGGRRRMREILCIGQATCDLTISVPAALVENQKYVIDRPFECGGGPAMNAACLLGRWGSRVFLLAHTGQDSYGERIRQDLKKYGVCTDYLMASEQDRTPYSFIFTNMSNGARTILNYQGSLSGEYPDFTGKKFDVILTDAHEPENSLRALEEFPEALSLIDAGTCRKKTVELARKVDYLVCSEDFAGQYTGQAFDLDRQAEVEELFRRIEAINGSELIEGRHTVVTLGERGLLFRENGVIRHLPAYPVKAVDTTGAGDIFHGAFAFGLSRKESMFSILKRSAVAAALSVQKKGGQTAVPSWEETEKCCRSWDPQRTAAGGT